MKYKKITYSIAGLDERYWQTVREFCVHREITIKAMILQAIDYYMAHHEQKQTKHTKKEE